MNWFNDLICKVCGEGLNKDSSYAYHARLGAAWHAHHTFKEVEAAVGEDVSTHTLLMHRPEVGAS